MNLKDYNCQSLEFHIFFSSSEFNKTAFLKDVDPKGTLGSYSFTFGSKEHPGQQHAHITIEFSSSPKESHYARILYIRSKREITNKRGRYMENCARWLGGFFKVEAKRLYIDASFEFDESYKPIIAMPFPFVPMTDGSKVLDGTSITGLAFEFPPNSKLQAAIIQYLYEETSLYVSAIPMVKIKRLSVANELKRISASVGQLITKRGETK